MKEEKKKAAGVQPISENKDVTEIQADSPSSENSCL
jgi:hypothetical protein